MFFKIYLYVFYFPLLFYYYTHDIVNRDFIPNFFVIYRPQSSKADAKRIESIIPI